MKKQKSDDDNDDDNFFAFSMLLVKVYLFLLSGLFYFNSLDRSISKSRVFWLVYITTMFYRNSTHSVDPDQILVPHSAASDLRLHHLPIILLGSPQLK